MDPNNVTPIDASEIPEGFTADGPGGASGGGSNNKAAERAAQVESILEQVLEPEALVRLKRIKIVRKEKAAQIEGMLYQAAVSGKLPGKISEGRLIEMLEGVKEASETKVKIQRRNYGIDSDDDDDDDDLL